MNHYVYEITNNINGKKYIGKRSCKCDVANDKYMGSGILLKKSIKRYGIENFTKEILLVCITKQEALEYEKLLIDKYDATKNTKYYNIHEGGKGGNTKAGYSEEQLRQFGQKVSNSLKNSSKFWSVISSEEYKEKKRKEMLNRENHMKNPKYKEMFSEMFSGEKNGMYGKGYLVSGEKNGMYGKTHDEHFRKNQSKRVSGGGNPTAIKCSAISPSGEIITADCIKDLANKIGFSKAVIASILRDNNEGVYNFSHMSRRGDIERNRRFDKWIFKRE